MAMNLVDIDDVRTSRRKGKRYEKYKDAIKPYLASFRHRIEASKDGNIRILNSDMADMIGMCGTHPTTIYWSLKYVLFKEGLWLNEGQTKKGKAILAIRFKKDGDVLPSTLARYIQEEYSHNM